METCSFLQFWKERGRGGWIEVQIGEKFGGKMNRFELRMSYSNKYGTEVPGVSSEMFRGPSPASERLSFLRRWTC